jgi:tetraacyldisaccharide 4'-kinase
MREPGFWWREPGAAAALLAPFGMLYGAVAANRMRGSGAAAGVPVICVGNFTLGGAGKTPAVIALCELLRQAGENPVCLTRGYGGSDAGPRLVDAHKDSAAEVGDEPLLIARIAPTIVARDRIAGAEFAKQHGASVIVMDDGLQNPSLKKDFTVAVVDARRGLGNGKVFPAGPLRAPFDVQIEVCDALLIVGDGFGADHVAASARSRNLPVWRARLEAGAHAVADIKRPVLAFAGIGDPDKFFASVEAAGLNIAERRAFPDHHRFSAEDAADLVMRADEQGLALITTEKDRARMTGDPAAAALLQRAHVLPVTMKFADEETLQRTVLERITRARG